MQIAHISTHIIRRKLMSTIRLDKYLADAGIGTRTEIKSYIKKGFVTINGEIAKKPDIKIHFETDEVTFRGEPVHLSIFEYFILNKPAGYVSATKDNTAPTVLSLIESTRHDLFPVGRLDKDTEGLLLITNDGALSHKLLSPKRHVDKTYYAKVDGIVTQDDILAFERGLKIGDEDLDVAMPSKLTILDINEQDNCSTVHITIQEGKFHQVKRMVQAVGKNVTYLQRISFGPMNLPNDLALGDFRPLTPGEIEMLQKF